MKYLALDVKQQTFNQLYLTSSVMLDLKLIILDVLIHIFIKIT